MASIDIGNTQAPTEEEVKTILDLAKSAENYSKIFILSREILIALAARDDLPESWKALTNNWTENQNDHDYFYDHYWVLARDGEEVKGDRIEDINYSATPSAKCQEEFQ